MIKQNNPPQIFKNISQALKNGKKFFVAGHKNPDGDSLGSTLAVCSLLRRLGKEVYAYSHDKPGEDLFFMPGLNAINFGVLPKEKDFDALVLLECSDKKRGGNLDSLFKTAKTVVNIDHHPTGETYGTINYIEPKASSTAEIITQIFQYMDIPPTKDEATCLYVGVATDTGRFLHSNTTPKSMSAAAYLLACGADIKTVNTVIYNTKPYKELKLLGRALEKMELCCKNQIAVIMLEEKDFKTLKVNPKHTQGIVSQPIMIPSVEVSLLLRQESEEIAANLRSKGALDVSRVAQTFGGGGHARAAGFRIKDGEIKAVAKETIKILAALLRKNK